MSNPSIYLPGQSFEVEVRGVQPAFFAGAELEVDVSCPTRRFICRDRVLRLRFVVSNPSFFAGTEF